MKVTPVTKYAAPGFPTHRILDEHPEMLRLVPERWQRNPVVLSALAGVCMLVCSSKALSADSSKKTPPARIAPIFQHGDGRGAFGCEAINPPVFLSEDEARQVIVEECKRVGIRFVPDAKLLRNVPVPSTNRYPALQILGSPSAKSDKSKTRTLPLKLDGTDERLRISYEYVSEQDFEAWEQPGIASTAYSIDTLGTAKELRKGLGKAHPSGAYAVFYDPMSRPRQSSWKAGISDADWQSERAKSEADALSTSREELRKQVRDFIVWLKGQGVI